MLKQLREVGHQLEELARTESGIRQKKEAATEEVRNLRNERDGKTFISISFPFDHSGLVSCLKCDCDGMHGRHLWSSHVPPNVILTNF